ncbi:MAG: hypothetical protein KAJ40_07285 [Alphaproteobacteria bacterium]|nr:hypothetical protein [Alphaproteobacteria bacterium]
MLKKLTAKHKEVLRRLVVGQDPKLIEQELNISAATVNRLQKDDPLFMSELAVLERAANDRITDSIERLSVIEKLEEGAHDAADLCLRVIRGEEKDVPVKLKLDSAWDVLDRAGHKPTEKKVIGVVNAADMIIAAYNAKHKTEGDKAAIDI